MLGRPETSEYAKYYGMYIDRVPAGDILDILDAQMKQTAALLTQVPENKANYRYASDKWSIKQIVGHLTDTERIFTVRALACARNDATAWPGFEQNDYVKNSNCDTRRLVDLVDEYRIVREASLSLFRSFDEPMSRRIGIANGVQFTARAIPYIVAGHDLHHRTVLEERYLK